MGDQAALGALFGFGIFVLFSSSSCCCFVPFILYLLNLQRCFEAVRPNSAAHAAGPGLAGARSRPRSLLSHRGGGALSTAVKKEGETAAPASSATAAWPRSGGGHPRPALDDPRSACCSPWAAWCAGSCTDQVAGFRKLLVGAPAGGQSAPPPPPQNWQPAAVPPHGAPPPPVAAVAPPAVETPAVPGREESTVRFGALDNAKLVCIVGVVQGMSFAIGNGVIVGRSPGGRRGRPGQPDLQSPCLDRPGPGRLILRDMQSTNGTYLNDNLGAPVQEVELRDGDVIVLGKHGQMKFRASLGWPGAAASSRVSAYCRRMFSASGTMAAKQTNHTNLRSII